MSNILSDGTVMPHYMKPISTWQAADSGQFTNVALRVGEIKDIILPTDKRSLSKHFIEYIVSCQHQDGVAISTSVIYSHCFLATLFGGASSADKFTFTFRKADTKLGPSNGSKVLLLCINGQTNQAVIIGGIHEQDPSFDTAVDSDKGHNLAFAFNGLSAIINKDGELVVTFAGATKANGTPADGVNTAKAGTTFQILKDGTFRMVSKTGVWVGDATDAWVLGTTYRKAESKCNSEVMKQLNIAMSNLTNASGQLTIAGTSMAVPVVGAVIASTPVTVAATAIANAALALQAAARAIQSFEVDAAKYLSKKNLTD